MIEGVIKDLVVKPLKNHIDNRGYLVEGWRSDFEELPEFKPEMLYVSYSRPNVRRGAHLHHYQRDYFLFMGPGNFYVVVIDNRPDSPTYKKVTRFFAGENNPKAVLIPTNCWHGYMNVSDKEGMVLNIPDKLYKGINYSDKEVDEVRMSWDSNYFINEFGFDWECSLEIKD